MTIQKVWEELDYNDGSDEPNTGGNYLINVVALHELKN